MCRNHREKSAPQPALQVWLPTGVARKRLCSPPVSDNSYARRTKHTESRAGGFCLSTPLLRCSQLQAIGLLCTKRLGRMAPLRGVRGFQPWQNDVSVDCAVAPGTFPGVQGIESNGLSWAQRGQHTVPLLGGSPCCISKSVLKLSCCSKAFPSE